MPVFNGKRSAPPTGHVTGAGGAGPECDVHEHWKEPEHHAAAMHAVESFLAAHTPR